jgi:GxxExxY protein
MEFDALSHRVAQLLTYLRLAGVKAGLLMNFQVTKLQDGIKRFFL